MSDHLKRYESSMTRIPSVFMPDDSLSECHLLSQSVCLTARLLHTQMAFHSSLYQATKQLLCQGFNTASKTSSRRLSSCLSQYTSYTAAQYQHR